MIVYICSPYGGKDKNVENARELMRYAIKRGHTPIAPHVLYHGTLNDNNPNERNIGLSSAISLMLRCDQVWMPDWTEKTAGMIGEQAMAIKMKIPVKAIERLEFLNTMIKREDPEDSIDDRE